MEKRALNSLTRKLREDRHQLFVEVEHAESDLRDISETRETESEQRASEECSAQLLSRLDERAKREIEEIDAALRRIGEGRYGMCASCGGRIEIKRLRALPTALLCVTCVREYERRPTGHAGVESLPAAPRLADLCELHDGEIDEVPRRIRPHGQH